MVVIVGSGDDYVEVFVVFVLVGGGGVVNSGILECVFEVGYGWWVRVVVILDGWSSVVVFGWVEGWVMFSVDVEGSVERVGVVFGSVLSDVVCLESVNIEVGLGVGGSV